MFDWFDDPITRIDLWSATLLIVVVIFAAFDRHREKTSEWLPNVLRMVRDERSPSIRDE